MKRDSLALYRLMMWMNKLSAAFSPYHYLLIYFSCMQANYKSFTTSLKCVFLCLSINLVVVKQITNMCFHKPWQLVLLQTSSPFPSASAPPPPPLPP